MSHDISLGYWSLVIQANWAHEVDEVFCHEPSRGVLLENRLHAFAMTGGIKE